MTGCLSILTTTGLSDLRVASNYFRVCPLGSLSHILLVEALRLVLEFLDEALLRRTFLSLPLLGTILIYLLSASFALEINFVDKFQPELSIYLHAQFLQ